jgi:hypothetical protein
MQVKFGDSVATSKYEIGEKLWLIRHGRDHEWAINGPFVVVSIIARYTQSASAVKIQFTYDVTVDPDGRWIMPEEIAGAEICRSEDNARRALELLTAPRTSVEKGQHELVFP